MVTTMLPAETTAPKPPPAPFPWVTVALLAANVGAFAVEVTSGLSLSGSGGTAGNTNAQILTSLGGNYARHTLDGDWWRLVTSLFLHTGPLALIMTVFCLGQLRNAESFFGRVGFAAIYLIGGIAGGISTIAHCAPNLVVVGGSGGVFALYGAYLAFLFLHKRNIEPIVWSASLRSAGVFLGINLVYSLGAAHVDPTPFFVGLASGGLMGVAIVRGRTMRARNLRGLAVIAAGLAVAAGTMLALPAPPPPVVDYAKLGAAGPYLEELIGLDKASVAALKAHTAGSDTPTWVAFQTRLATATVPANQRAVFDAMAVHVTAHLRLLDDLSRRPLPSKDDLAPDIKAEAASVHDLAAQTRMLGGL